MIRVPSGNSEMVAEGRRGLLEGNPVFAEVLGGFVQIPFKLDVSSVAIVASLYEAKLGPSWPW